VSPKTRASDWSIALRVAPLIVVTALAKLGADLAGWDTVELNPLHTGLVAGNIFLIGFLLAGTLADYKESERIPGELAARAETIADECEILHADTGADAARACLAQVGAFARSVDGWMRGTTTIEAPLDAIEGFNEHFLAFQPLTQPNFIVRLKQEQALLRLLVFRINTIKETSFVGAGYVISWIASLLLVVALVLADFAAIGAELFLVCAITFLVTYLVLLIRDLDDPFDYDEHGRRGSAEVSLAPLDRLVRRMDHELQRLDDAPRKAAVDEGAAEL
jgi:hypothetical protein